MNPLTIVRLKGSQAEMGAQYGRLARQHPQMDRAFETMTTLSYRLLRDANAHTVVGRLTGVAISGLLAQGRLRMERRRPTAYRQRSEAFMEAAGLPRSAAGHMALMDVFQSVIGLAGRRGMGPFGANASGDPGSLGKAVRPVPACSSLAVWGDSSDGGALRHARNFDFPCIGVWDKTPTVVFCDPDEGMRYGYVGAFGVDAPGCTGFNEAGLTVAAHTRFHSEARFSGACVVDVCHEISRTAETLADAEAIIAAHNPAAPWGLLITSAREQRAVVLETTGRRYARLDPASTSDGHSADASHLSCTNWNRHPDVVDGQVAPYPSWSEHSDSRWRRLEQIVASSPGPLSRIDLMRALGDHVDPHTDPATERVAGGCIAQASTVTSVVFDSGNESLCVSVGDAPTSWGPYVDVPWSWEGEVGASTLTHPDSPAELREVAWSESTSIADVVAPRLPHRGGETAFGAWSTAITADVDRHDSREVLEMVETAIERSRIQPTGPEAVYLFMAGVLRLRHGDWHIALDHLRAALPLEPNPLRRAQIHLWTARALHVVSASPPPTAATAATGEELRTEAAGHLESALAIDAPHVAGFHTQARADQRCAPSPAKLRRLTYSLDLVDAAV